MIHPPTGPAAAAGPIPDPVQQEGEPDSLRTALSILRATPPWLTSLIVHALALIVLSLIVVPQRTDDSVRIEAIFAENLGQQLEEETAWVGSSPETPIDQQIITPEDLPPVEDPLAAPPKMDWTMRPNSLSGQEDAPVAGLALAGRETGFKRALLAAYGGNATTEAAVARGLAWLARNQRRDGSWSLTGPYEDGSQVENRLAATAMALLAFQGAGNTHLDGQHQDQVAKGWQWLSKQQNAEGDFWKGGTYNHRLYSQAQATIAVCELYGMSREAALRGPAQLAINYAVKSQGRHGGWRYQPGDESDTSVTGWFVMALQSGLMAGLTVPSPTLDRVSEYLDTVASDGGSLYSYRPGQPATPSMTAEALLCRQYLGWSRDDPRLVAGIAYLGENPINWGEQNVYYWYYAAQTLHHMEGDAWETWNGVMRQTLPEKQIADGKEEGSWSPENDQWGMFGGRLYTTCLCVYMLEVYYRHLPIYAPVYGLRQ